MIFNYMNSATDDVDKTCPKMKASIFHSVYSRAVLPIGEGLFEGIA